MAVKMEPESVIEMELGLEPYGEAHNFFASECRNRMNEKYVPEDTKTLIDTSYIDGECNIHYDQPYARYMYYGKLMVDPETGSSYAKKGHKKVLTDKDLVYHKKGGPYWDQKMITAEGKEIEKVMQDYISKRGRK